MGAKSNSHLDARQDHDDLQVVGRTWHRQIPANNNSSEDDKRWTPTTNATSATPAPTHIKYQWPTTRTRIYRAGNSQTSLRTYWICYYIIHIINYLLRSCKTVPKTKYVINARRTWRPITILSNQSKILYELLVITCVKGSPVQSTSRRSNKADFHTTPKGGWCNLCAVKREYQTYQATALGQLKSSTGMHDAKSQSSGNTLGGGDEWEPAGESYHCPTSMKNTGWQRTLFDWATLCRNPKQQRPVWNVADARATACNSAQNGNGQRSPGGWTHTCTHNQKANSNCATEVLSRPFLLEPIWVGYNLQAGNNFARTPLTNNPKVLYGSE